MGGRLFDSVRSFVKRRNEQADFPSLAWSPQTYTISASLLERYLLKIMIGFAFNGPLLVGEEASESGVIPENLVRAAFGISSLPFGQGLYVAYRDRETFNLEDRFHYTAKTINGRLLLGYFTLHGLRFYLNLESTGPSKHRAIEGSNVFYREAHFIEASPTLAHGTDLHALIRRPANYSQKLSIQ